MKNINQNFPMKQTHMPKKSVCLVTNELYPFASGGIGRLVYNWVVQNFESGEPVKISLLFPCELAEKIDAIRVFCVKYNIDFYFCDENDLKITYMGDFILSGLKNNWDYLHPYRVSYQYFVTLLKLERSGIKFDIVEFPDYGGWGAVTIEAKRAVIAFITTQICVRLHSTYGIIVAIERFYHNPSGYGAGTVDLEQFALRHADHIIAHQKSILDFNYSFYKFDESWLKKTQVERPPILLDDFELNKEELPVQRFVYSSRLQPFKRPDIFLRAACIFYDKFPNHNSEAIVVSYGWDKDYIESLVSIVPGRHREKIKFFFDLKGETRQELLAGAIIVIPSDYESYCLFAYETALMKRRILLRRDCLAFSSVEGWTDGENCLHFGSDPVELADVMLRALNWVPSSHRITSFSLPYWTNLTLPPNLDNKNNSRLTHELIIHNVTVAADVISAFEFVSKEDIQFVTIIIKSNININDIKSIAQQYKINPNIITSTYQDNFFGDLWSKIVTSKADIVTAIFASDRADAFYLKIVDQAFNMNQKIDIITSNEGVVDGYTGSAVTFRPIAGEHFVSSLSGISNVGRLFSIRPTFAASLKFPGASQGFIAEDIFNNSVLSGCSICVLPDLYYSTQYEVGHARDARWATTKIADISRGMTGLGVGIGLQLSAKSQSFHSSIFRIRADHHTPIRRIFPHGSESWGDPVSYSPDYEGFLIHPVEQGMTIARIVFPKRDIYASMIFADVENANSNNDGFIITILPGNCLNLNEILESVEMHRYPQSSEILMPLQKSTIRVSVPVSDIQTHFYIAVQNTPGGSVSNCHAIVRSYGAII